jgi:DNA-binding MurR/RpiR family transcriptional regulator
MIPRELTITAIHLIDYLTTIKNADNIAVATIDDFVSNTGFSVPSISRAKNQLTELGFMKKKASNIYIVLKTL